MQYVPVRSRSPITEGFDFVINYFLVICLDSDRAPSFRPRKGPVSLPACLSDFETTRHETLPCSSANTEAALIETAVKRYLKIFSESVLTAGRFAADPVVFAKFSSTSLEATCLICGQCVLSTDRQVRCTACSTVHHQECWEFFGMCSTYACGEKRFDSIRGS